MLPIESPEESIAYCVEAPRFEKTVATSYGHYITHPPSQESSLNKVGRIVASILRPATICFIGSITVGCIIGYPLPLSLRFGAISALANVVMSVLSRVI
jgi:hypothetical protein